MHHRLALAPLAFALLLGCGSSTPKPADGAEKETADTPPPAVEPSDEVVKPPPPPPPAVGAVKREAAATDLPDDYSLTDNDCQALGRQYTDAARSDQRAGISPKLAAKARAQAEASIDGVVVKIGADWAESCMKSLAGKNVDHKKITCALAAKTVKTFDVCLNGEKK
jgi:hypothetical protein